MLLLGLTAAASATDEVIQKKLFGSGTTSLIISKEEMEDIMKSVKFLEEPDLLIKKSVKQLKMKQSNKKANFPQCYWAH